jgi:hypothetical protein
MALFNQTNKMDPIELFKWFQERKANASLRLRVGKTMRWAASRVM